MKRYQKSLIWLALVGALGLGSTASFAGRHEHEGDRGHSQRFEQRMLERANALKTALNLSATQEDAWVNFQKDLKPKDRSDQHERQAKREAFKSMDTLERLDWMKTMKAQRDAQMERRDQAIRSFYGQLSSEQKKIFDSQFWMRSGPRGDGERHHGPQTDGKPASK